MADAPRLDGDVFVCESARISEAPLIHAALRSSGPLVQVEAPAGGPAWVVTDETLARQVLSDARFVKDPALAPEHWYGRDPGLEPPAFQVRSLTTLDGPEHRRLRAVHAPVFTRRRLLARQAQIAVIARDLLTSLAADSKRTGRPVDLIAEFTGVYPLLVICDLLGVPMADVTPTRDVCHAMTRGDDGRAAAGMEDLQALVAAAIRAGRAQPRGSRAVELLADRARTEFGDVSDADLLYMISGLIFAGQVTTEAALGFVLAHHLAVQVDADACTADALVSESLRLHPPAPFTLWRFATASGELAGVHLPAGAPVLVDIEGINTDPGRHTSPTALDPNRPHRPDLTFGAGPHMCIGAQLAQMEARIVVDVLRTDFPDAHLAVDFEQLERDLATAQSRRLTGLPAWLRSRDSDPLPPPPSARTRQCRNSWGRSVLTPRRDPPPPATGPRGSTAAAM